MIGFSASSQVSFEGNKKAIFSENPGASTGLDNIYVAYNLNDTQINYTSDSPTNKVVWYKYDEQGGGYAEVISNMTYDGAKSTLSTIIPNSGYIIEDGTTRKYFWVVDYSKYYLELGNITFGQETDCNVTLLNLDGKGDDIIYYTINGVPKKLSRDINISYNSLEWSEDDKNFKQIEKQLTEETYKSSYAVEAPYMNTQFNISGDRFLTYWGETEKVTSDTYTTNAVAVNSTATQESPTTTDQGTLGGSAPAIIEFASYSTDAVTHKEWQIATDTDFEKIIHRFTDETLNYTFDETGTFYVRFVGSNGDGTCESMSDTYTVAIGESKLVCPNAFSPQSTEGVNDIWKVSYKSIISFNCYIFNRWGVEMFRFSNPDDGWDGKYKGKYVGSGVYFYVIDAKGADGKNYKLKGDINIINYSNSNNSNSSNETK